MFKGSVSFLPWIWYELIYCMISGEVNYNYLFPKRLSALVDNNIGDHGFGECRVAFARIYFLDKN